MSRSVAIWRLDKEERARLAGKSYQPSNGSEGEAFYEGMCAYCEHDRKYAETLNGEDGCSIIAQAMLYNPGDADYPAEWVYNSEGYPTCTAFEHINDPIHVVRDRFGDNYDGEHQLRIFEE